MKYIRGCSVLNLFSQDMTIENLQNDNQQEESEDAVFVFSGWKQLYILYEK